MIKPLLTLLAFAFTTIVSAQDLVQARKTIDTLASPSMHGRGYVSKGDSLAAAYIAKQYQEIGLLPLKNGSYFQRYDISVNTFPGKVMLKDGINNLKCGSSFIVSPNSAPIKGKFKAFDLDSSLFFSPQKKSLFLTLDLRNAALIIDAKWKSKIRQQSAEIQAKFEQAPLWIFLQPKKLTASVAQNQLKHVEIEVLKDSFDLKPANIKAHIEATLIPKYTTQNVIGFVRGTVKADSFLIVCAHYDHLGRMGKDVYFPGANDNAAGIAMMLELAKNYVANPPKYSMIFIAFGAEEIGLLGSKFYTQNPVFPLNQVKFVTNLDLVGTGDDGATVVNATIFPQEFEQMDSINREKSLLTKINKRGKAANSDHYHFSELGVHSFFLYGLGGISAYHDIYDKSASLPMTKFKEIYTLVKEFNDKF